MSTRIELSAPPRTTTLFAKAALGALPGLPRPRELPSTEFVLAARPVDRERLADYSRLCGFALSDELPITYPHVLGFGLAMRLMTGRDFPFPLIGLVHIANRITRYRATGADEPLGLRVRAGDLVPHERGRQFTLTTEATVDGELVWAEHSTYLRRDGSAQRRSAGGPADTGAKPGSADAAAASRPASAPPEPKAVWRLPEDIGRRYAAVSGDVNPIHLHRLAARALGFRRAIAHGMYTEARCLAAMAKRLPEACTVDVRFGRPVLLPGTVDFSILPVEGGWDFGLHGSGAKMHLTGTVRPVVPGRAAPSIAG